ncbi:flagellar hook-basal body complex protein FliE [mine drainage metagenome]|uniref:Flagellar hook-basal body complex protein FliE n=1 Tax=mine drainage metagenome TaxID=410659 RepID=A0A1J5RCM1_9ZZZZ
MATTSIANALSAYANVAKSFGDTTAAPADDQAVTGSGSDFAALLRKGVESAIDSGKKSEQLSQQALAGKADIPEVVAAVSNAELTLQTVVAVRDKVVNAYNDILKMSF